MPYTNNVKPGAWCRLRCTLSHLLNGVLAGNGILPSVHHNLIYLKASYEFTYLNCSCSGGKSPFDCRKVLSFLLLISTVSFVSDCILWQHLERKIFLAFSTKIFPFLLYFPGYNITVSQWRMSNNFITCYITVQRNLFHSTRAINRKY